MTHVDEDSFPPDFMIIGTFRYCLGRMTMFPHIFIEWAERHWHQIPKGVKQTIHREVKEKIKEGVRSKKIYKKKFSMKEPVGALHFLDPLGMEVDRRAWISFLVKTREIDKKDKEEARKPKG